MKKILNLAFVAMLVIGAVSCSKEQADINNGGQDTKGNLTINLPITGAAATYVAAEAGESYVDQAIKLYAFDNTALTLSKIYTSADIIQSTVGTTKKATINVEGLPADVKFYIVADNGSATSKLNTAAVGMTEADFIVLATAAQAGHLATPLLLTGSVVVTDAVNAKTVTASVWRSVARFDIDNNVAVTNVEIKAITFSNVNLNGYIFGYDQRLAGNHIMTATAPAVGNLPNITVAPAVADVQSKLSAFYLYPVVLKSAPGVSDAKVQIVGSVSGGVEKIYTLKSATDITIEANRRYKIKAIDSKTSTFTITAEEWEEGNGGTDIDGGYTPDGGASGFIAGSAVAHTGATVDGGNAFAVTPGGSTFEFAVMSSSPTKPVVTVVPDATIAGWAQLGASAITTTVTTATTITYGAPYYKTTVSVTILDGKVLDSESFLSEIKVTDKNGSVSSVRVYHASAEVANEYYPGTTLKPVVVGGVTWAPVNVGAENNDVTQLRTSSSGFAFQWGRNTPFDAFAKDRNLSTVLTTKELAESTDYESVFIVGTKTYPNWIIENAPAPWGMSKRQGPCPDGWQIPTSTDLGLLAALHSQGNVIVETNKLTFAGQAGSTLIIPIAAGIYWDGAQGRGSADIRDMGYYWSVKSAGEDQDNLAKARRLAVINISGRVSSMSDAEKGNAYAIRCVKN